jgi:ribosomal protein S18 acetylase RimI-like enzyme
MSQSPNTLPEGYTFVAKDAIEPSEIITLRESVGWTGDSPKVWETCIEQPGILLGVRDTANAELVGMGRVTADPRHAVLCDLAVNPAHQSQGIGKAIVWRRMLLALSAKTPYLYTELAPTSPLRPFYEELGFIATGHGLIRKAQ